MNALLQCLKVIPIIKSVYVTTDRYITITTRSPPRVNYHFADVSTHFQGFKKYITEIGK